MYGVRYQEYFIKVHINSTMSCVFVCIQEQVPWTGKQSEIHVFIQHAQAVDQNN